jgi:uncharacterized protein (DUF2249 family)
MKNPSLPPLDLDVRPLVARQKPPLPAILDALARLTPGQALRLRVPFEPAPLYPLLKQRGFRAEPRPCDDGSWEVVFTPESLV